MACPAYQSMDAISRQLLTELRSLYRPSSGNEVFLSVREAMIRMGLSQRPVQNAFKALLERGWIEKVGEASFRQKAGERRAQTFLLTNIGPSGTETGAKKTYMRWQPSTDPYGTECQKKPVAAEATDR
ncbi:helix-turn-helix domain-containing protein [Xanthomonas citri]|nr:helix-turn-helix domain-containing protein [Xanthomonas citri]